MNTIVFMITCLLFLSLFVGLPIVGIAWLTINFVENRRKKEMEKTDMIARVAKQMINNADVILRTDKLIAEGKLKDSTIEQVVGK